MAVVSGLAISQLSKPFEGGSGPAHSAIERIWLVEDALEYLPQEGNKTNRVTHGLLALKDGRRGAVGQRDLAPAPDKLNGVVVALADLLLGHGVPSSDLSAALEIKNGPSSASDSSAARPDPGDNEAGDAGEGPIDAQGPIFIVHGHDQELRHEASRVIERMTGRDVVVLHEQPNAGRTLLEKFEEHAVAASYAVVLLTGDDVGASATGGASQPRGRQNVIFELGFFFGKLGRDRVAVLLREGVEQPSDISGLVYLAVRDDGGWKYKLARELRAAGITVDPSRIP